MDDDCEHDIYCSGRVYHMNVARGQSRLKNGLGRKEEFPVRKFSTRKWSESGHKMAAIICSHHSNALFFRRSALVELTTLYSLVTENRNSVHL